MYFDDITVLNVHVNKKKENSNHGDISKILVCVSPLKSSFIHTLIGTYQPSVQPLVKLIESKE